MKIGILTDSGCNLKQELLKKHQIDVMPLIVQFNGQEYITGIEIDKQTIAHRICGAESLPAVKAPSVQAFAARYRELAADYDYLVSLHTTQTLSSAVDKARAAAEQVDELSITVIDSGTTSLGLGLLVCFAGKLRDEGVNYPEIVELLRKARRQLAVYLVVEKLACVEKAGLISKLKSYLLRNLNISLIFKSGLETENLDQISYIWGQKKTANRLVSLMKEQIQEADKAWVGWIYGSEQSDFSRVKELFSSTLEEQQLSYYLFNSLLGLPLLAKVGPQAYGGAVLTGDFLD